MGPDRKLKDGLFGAQPADVPKKQFTSAELSLGFSLDDAPVR